MKFADVLESKVSRDVVQRVLIHSNKGQVL